MLGRNGVHIVYVFTNNRMMQRFKEPQKFAERVGEEEDEDVEVDHEQV